MTEINLPGKPDMSSIDDIPWLELHHAYGTAIDVPNQLRGVLDPNPERRRNVFYSFMCNLFHQGSVYPATIPAIGLLQKILRYKDVPDKAKILETLLAFAVGFPDDIDCNIDVAKFVAAGEVDENEDVRGDDAITRECYLAVGAGAPLYDALLRDPDPCTVIAAAYVLAFFPAHASTSCQQLLDISESTSQHDYVRSSALIAGSYLGGENHKSFREATRRLVEAESMDAPKPVPLLSATAAYVVLRCPNEELDSSQKARASCLADRCLTYDVLLPDCDFYSVFKSESAGDNRLDVQALLMPDSRFPWGDLVVRIQQLTGRQSAAIVARLKKKKRSQEPLTLPQPDSFKVKPDSLDSENIAAAVRRYHANFIGDRKNIVEATKEFSPFQPVALQAWGTILELLDSEIIENRWAAASLLERLEPLSEFQVGQLIERLHLNNNRSLEAAIRKQAVTNEQCQDLCDRLCQGEFDLSEHATNRDDYRRIVIQHGTDLQLWQLYEHGEESERSAAIKGLLHRGQIDASDSRAYQATVTDLLSGNYGRAVQAKFTFAKSEDAQKWFFNNMDSLLESHRWAILEAMDSFDADLSSLREQIFSRIEIEENAVIQARLIGLTRHFSAVDSGVIDRLMSGLSGDVTSLQKSAVIQVLGSWLESDEVRADALVRLHPFLDDGSARVRRIVLEQFANDSAGAHEKVIRDSLKDSDPENVRHAMWYLARRNALTEDDLSLLLDREQLDRVSAETYLALATYPQKRPAKRIADMPAENGPLTESLRQWSRSNAMI